jgi:hypothetical protein
MDGSGDSLTTKERDGATEAAVMRLVLALHPVQVTVAEIVLELSGENPSFAEQDGIERAVRDLAGAGLLHRVEQLVMPTRAAIRFSELLDR